MHDYRNSDAAGKGCDFPRSLPTMNIFALPFRDHGFTIPKTPLNQYGPNFDPLLLPCRQAGLLKLSMPIQF